MGYLLRGGMCLCDPYEGFYEEFFLLSIGVYVLRLRFSLPEEFGLTVTRMGVHLADDLECCDWCYMGL